MARRVLVAYLALAAAIALVAGVGAAVQPIYGSDPPWQGVRVDELRSAPVRSTWAVQLAGIVAPGAPAECVRFTSTDVGRDRAVVRADSAWSFGFADDAVCSAVPSGFRSRLILLDTASGRVVWTHDTTNDLSGGDGATIGWTSVVEKGTRILVRAENADRSVVETLSSRTGHVVDRMPSSHFDQQDRFTASGNVVAIGRLSSDGLSYDYELRDVRNLGGLVWSGSGNSTATMIALDDRLLLGSDHTLQIPLATGSPKPWGAALDTTLGYAVHDDIVYTGRTTGSGITVKAAKGFVAVSKTGKTLWGSDLSLLGSYSLTRSCLAVTNRDGDRLTCLDYGTGKELWSDDIGSFTFAGSSPGQRSEDVYAVSSSNESRVTAIDGRTGRIRFREAVPAGSSLAAASQTVGYVLAYGVSGSRSTVIALDLSSGQRLWSHRASQQVAVWGGHLIDIGVDGTARRLGG